MPVRRPGLHRTHLVESAPAAGPHLASEKSTPIFRTEDLRACRVPKRTFN